MARKSTPTEQAARMLDLVPFISSHQGISTTELAAEFGISVDELLGDLNSLWMCGDNRFDLIDLEFESGYVTIRNAQTLNLIRSLSQQEIISVLIGLDLIAKSLPSKREDLLLDISNLKSKLGGEMARMLDASPVHDGEILSIVRQGLDQQRKVMITYFSPTEDRVTNRSVIPLQIFTKDEYSFLIAFCESANAQRTFRVDRIQSATLNEKSHVIPNSIVADDLRNTVEIAILSNVRRSRESLGSFVQGEGDRVAVSSYSAGWLLRTVIAAAGAMEVTSAPELRQQIAAAAQKTLDLYR
jgi:proteasome accessory factor C